MGSQGERDSIVLGAIELGGGGGNLSKIHQFIKLYYFSADLQNEIKSFDTAIDQSIVEVLPGWLRWNVREGRFAIVWRRDEKYKK